MSDQSPTAKSVFLSAIEKYQPEQWPAFLDDACPDDTPLRAQVEKLNFACLAMWALLEENTDLTPEDLTQRINVLKSVPKKAAILCHHCNTKMSRIAKSLNKCLYCGTARPKRKNIIEELKEFSSEA